MELAFKEVDCESMFDALLQHFLNYGLVFSFGIATTDKNIVEVLDIFFHVFEDCIHHFLKSCRGVGQAEWHHCVFAESLLGMEDCLAFLSCCYPYQVVPILQIQPCKPLSAPCLVT